MQTHPGCQRQSWRQCCGSRPPPHPRQWCPGHHAAPLPPPAPPPQLQPPQTPHGAPAAAAGSPAAPTHACGFSGELCHGHELHDSGQERIWACQGPRGARMQGRKLGRALLKLKLRRQQASVAGSEPSCSRTVFVHHCRLNCKLPGVAMLLCQVCTAQVQEQRFAALPCQLALLCHAFSTCCKALPGHQTPHRRAGQAWPACSAGNMPGGGPGGRRQTLC